ncbi:SusC/RagA family TonB-linked outer membrane protein [Bacteroidia bacterium]|nr:SusC/RagA family TonB-linked outer membrane protein [Bacteroidia bacterium]
MAEAVSSEPAVNEVAQQRKKITGVVKDSEGEAIIGATVAVKGSGQGTVTNFDGYFELDVADNATLTISFVGYTPQEIPVRGKSAFQITLSEDLKTLEEVVVIGYGTRAKKDLTGAVSQINSDEILKQVNVSPEFAMQGKMAGVMVSNPGSSPVARPTIRIRGVSTLGYNDPLYVVDGIPLTEGFASSNLAGEQDFRGNVNVFSMINPNDIESISVLKDASATAIYGVRASNGVILITTKRGAEGKPKVNLSMNYGIQNLFKRYDVVSTQQYVDLGLEAINANKNYNKEWWYPLFDKSSSEYLGNSPDYSKDWMDAALVENAAIQDYNLSISGGTKMSTYALGAGYTSQDEVIYKNSYGRYSFYMNSDHKLTNWLKVGESYRFMYTKYKSASETPNFSSMSFVIPWQPFYDPTRPDGLATPSRTVNGQFQGYGYAPATIGNFMGVHDNTRAERDMLRNMGTFYAEISPLKGLRLRSTFSFDYYTNRREEYMQPGRTDFSVVPQDLTSEGNRYGKRDLENINIVKEFLVAYNNTFANHSFDLVLNAMSQDIRWNSNQQSIDRNSPITSWDQRYINEGWAMEDKGLFYNRYSSGLIGYMGRLSYNYFQKYYLDVTVRRDGSSKFAPGHKWGTFPSLAGAWRISSEKFMENISWMNDLKLRGGWGKSGNQETRDYAFLSMVNMNPKAAFGTSGTVVGDGIIYPASALGDFPIVDMGWETVTTYSFGFDLIALQNKLSFTAEWYNRQTDGILQTITSIPWTIGALNPPVVNLAKVNNRGLEMQAGYNDRFGDVGVNASVNFTTVRNRVSDLYRNQPTVNGDTRIESGYSMNYIYGYKADGIFQTEAEVADWVAKNNDVGNSVQKAPGDVRYVDLYGAPKDGAPEGTLKDYAPDGKIDDFDKTYLGKTIPGYYYGINLGATYKNWDLTLGFRGVGDVQRVNSLGLTSISGGGQRYLKDYLDRWTPEKHSNTIPRAIQGDPSGNNRMSSRFVQDASFLRFQNFQIGYNFKGELLNKANITNLRCYVSGSNLFVISSYHDLDPENITTPTVFSVGANISF